MCVCVYYVFVFVWLQCMCISVIFLFLLFPDKSTADSSSKEGNDIHVLIITTFTAEIVCLMFTELCPCTSSADVKVLCYCVSLLSLPLMMFIYLMTAAHDEIATEGQIGGVGESDQQTLSK